MSTTHWQWLIHIRSAAIIWRHISQRRCITGETECISFVKYVVRFFAAVASKNQSLLAATRTNAITQRVSKWKSNIPLDMSRSFHRNMFRSSILLIHGIDTCKCLHPKFFRYFPNGTKKNYLRRILKLNPKDRQKPMNRAMATYSQALIFVFNVDANAHALCSVVTLEFRAIALLLPAVTFAPCVLFNFYQFLIQ